MTKTSFLGDKPVNRIGFGAMQLAGPGVFGPPQDPEAARAVLRRAIELGVDHIDTAQYYGPDVVNDLIRDNGIEGDIGLLSIDIDGNDYWVWKAITCVRPRILVLEYNALFGPRAAVTVPYDPTFFRTRAHYSNLFWGASLEALTRLSRDKGYILVGCNSAGNNAFYVRADLRGQLEEMSVQSAFVQAQFRESRDAAGLPTYLDLAAGRLLIGELEVWDIDAKLLVPVRTALGGILNHAK